MDDLSTWLLEQVRADEQDAQSMEHLNVDDGGFHSCPAVHTEPFGDLPWGEDACDCGMPARRARLLAECEAKRSLIRWVLDWPLRPAPPSSVDGVLERIASVYADRPGYQESWRPA